MKSLAVKRLAIAPCLNRSATILLASGQSIHATIVLLEDDFAILAGGGFIALDQIQSVIPERSQADSFDAAKPQYSPEVSPPARPEPIPPSASSPSAADATDARATDREQNRQPAPVPPGTLHAAPSVATRDSPRSATEPRFSKPPASAGLPLDRAPPSGPSPPDAAVFLESLRMETARFAAQVGSFEWTSTKVPPLPTTKIPPLPPTLPHSTQVKQQWSHATNFLARRSWNQAREEFLRFASMAPMCVEGIWGAAFAAEQQGDIVQSLAILQWRSLLVTANEMLTRALASLALTLRMPQSAIRCLRASASGVLVHEYVMLSCQYGLFGQLASFLDEERSIAYSDRDLLARYLLLKLHERRPGIAPPGSAASEVTVLSVLPALLAGLDDEPTQRYLDAAPAETRLLGDIAAFQDSFKDRELAVREEPSVGSYVTMIDGFRRALEFEEARRRAALAFSLSKSTHWKTTFRKLISEIEADAPKTTTLTVKRPPAPKPAPPRAVSSQAAPLWQQASEAAVLGELNRAISLYQKFLDDAAQKPEWPDRADQAVNGLAVVYNQQGKRQQAIDTMLKYQGRVRTRVKFHNQLATLYYLTGQFRESSQHFHIAASLASGPIEKQKAIKNAENAAERARGVRLPPGDAVNVDDIYAEQLKREYWGTALDAPVRMAEVTLDLDPFLEPDVERLTKNGSDISGIERATIARSEFDFNTVHQLDKKAAKVEKTQGLRSQMLASALWLVYHRKWHRSAEALDNLPDLRLLQTRLAGSLGDDAAAQNRNDVAREYYTCVLKRGPSEGMAIAKVRDYLRTMTGERFESGSNKWKWDRLRDLLDGKAEGGPDTRRRVLWTIIHIASLSQVAYNAVIDVLDPVASSLLTATLHLIPGLREDGAELKTVVREGSRIVSAREDEIHGQFQRFSVEQFSIVRMAATADDDFRRFDYDLPHNPIDFTSHGRMTRLRASVLAPILSYLGATSTYEKQFRYSAAIAAIDAAIRDVAEHPTWFGRSTLLPILDRWRAELEKHHEEWELTVAPVLQVVCESPYDRGGSYEFDLIISNGSSCMAALDVRVEISIEFTGATPLQAKLTEGSIDRPLEGGAAESQRWRVTKPPTGNAAASAIGRAVLTHLDKKGTTHRAEVEFDVPLQNITYHELTSPYNPGQPVRTDEMLKGRRALVDELCAGVANREKCPFFRITGARRIGKSSILEAVRRKLELAADGSLFVMDRTDIGTLPVEGGHVIQVILRTWAEQIRQAATRRACTLSELTWSPDSAPTDRFLTWLRDEVKPYGHPVLLLDEFQRFMKISDDRILEVFFSFWKLMIERGDISGIICGQDSLDELIAQRRIGNMLSVNETKKVDYLDEKAARELIEGPIPLPNDLPPPFNSLRGKSRYTERAVQRILDLTGRGPYYIQLLCNIIVKLLNAEKQMLVTKMIVEKAVKIFLQEAESGGTVFENLTEFNPANPKKDSDSEMEGRILSSIAIQTMERHHCGISAQIQNWGRYRDDAMRILNRLERSGVVVSEPQSANHRIRVGLFKMWLNENRTFGDHPEPEL